MYFAQVRGVASSMVVDLGVGIEGTQEDELPEAILAETRFDHVGLEGAEPLNSPGKSGAEPDGASGGGSGAATPR
jgi:hypothetical protein